MMEIYWTYEKCKNESLKYYNKRDLRANLPSVYSKIIKNKWYELFNHMETLRKPKGYWTYERCREVARKCQNRTEFYKKESWAYNISLSNGWIDEICSHMIKVGNIKKRCIYLYEFKNKIAYIGLTYDIDKRWEKRLLDVNDIVNIYIQNNNEIPEIKMLTDYIDVNEAIIKENYFIDKYKKEGWVLLNRVRGGSIGGINKKWTYDKCKEVVNRYKTLSDLKKNDNLCLATIYRNKWHNLLEVLMKTKCGGYWTYDKCKEESTKYKTKTLFSKGSRGAYATSLKNGWLTDFY